MFSSRITADAPAVAGKRAPGAERFDILLEPVSHPELGEVRIGETLFAIGRTESPFATYPAELVADMSRRHARIFCERGAVYVADLGSKNGTSVNGVDIRQKTQPLQDGDEVSFAGVLTYRVHLGASPGAPARREKLLSLTLTPEREDLGLQPIVVAQFPFLVSKTDATFSRYRADFPHQVDYLSRRHAHLFLKGTAPFVEDLGSTNGTFLNGQRLDEHAAELHEGDVLAFGGHHFVYRVGLQLEEAASEPTLTKFRPAVAAIGKEAETDKTTFVVAPDSFLDIFCVDVAQSQEDKPNEDKQPADAPAREAEKRAPRSKTGVFLAELGKALSSGDRPKRRRTLAWVVSLAVIAGVGGVALYQWDASQREVKELLDKGDYTRAAALVERQLQREPDNAALKALATEALLKAHVPEWLQALKAGQFDRADAILVALGENSRNNTDLQPLLAELQWIGSLERFVMGRGGVEAPIRMYADEEKVRALIKRWEQDKPEHQRAFATISSYVPQFKDPYAEALSHLRKLQSDDLVYLAAADRLNGTIAAELERDQPEALEPVLKEYGEKYARLALDDVRRDLRRYTELLAHLRARDLAGLTPILTGGDFSTPPFQARFRALGAGDRLPPAALVQQYAAVSKAWRAGDVKSALTALQAIESGAWADAVAKQLERKKATAEQFAELQKTRSAKGYDERLLAFYGALDPYEDAYFVRAAETNLDLDKGKAMRRAQELLGAARERWHAYQQNGGIEGKQRLESGVSAQLRAQAQRLTQAQQQAQQGMRIYAQLRVERPAESVKLQEEIDAEAQSQRKAMMELRNVLEPGLFKTKLQLFGGPSDDEGQSPKTAE